MPEIIDEGPGHLHITDTDTGVSVFKTYDHDKCRNSPDGKHDWNGPGYERGNEGGSTCLHCGMEFGEFALWCLP